MRNDISGIQLRELFQVFFLPRSAFSREKIVSQIARNNALSVLAVYGYLCPVKAETISHIQSAHYVVDQNKTGKF